MDDYGADQAAGKFAVLRQAECVEAHADFLGEVVADGIAVGKAGDIRDATTAAERRQRVASGFLASIETLRGTAVFQQFTGFVGMDIAAGKAGGEWEKIADQVFSAMRWAMWARASST